MRTLDTLIELGEAISDEQLSVAKSQARPEHLFLYTFSSVGKNQNLLAGITVNLCSIICAPCMYDSYLSRCERKLEKLLLFIEESWYTIMYRHKC